MACPAWWTKFKETNTYEYITIVFKIAFALFMLYMFIVSLGILSDAFSVVGGSQLNKVLYEPKYQKVLSNPICGLMVGTFITVIVQSSSTSTSIVITMVGAEILTVEQAIYFVMGANIGTSVTSTLVAFANIGENAEFGRAIASAVVLSAFNLFTALTLLPIEVCCQMLERLTGLAVGAVHDRSASNGTSVDPIAVITGPIKNRIIGIKPNALGNNDFNDSFVEYCASEVAECKGTCGWSDTACQTINEDYCLVPDDKWNCKWENETTAKSFEAFYGSHCTKQTDFMWEGTCWSDVNVGGVVLVIALVIMFGSLITIVKCLKSMLSGHISVAIHRIVDKDLPPPFTCLTPYLYILLGILVTCSVQSSSIVCSIITPLCGINVISLDRAYVMIIGCCIGTTCTGLIAAFANMGAEAFTRSLQVALAHLFFNTIGMIIWYIIPVTIFRIKAPPVALAEFAGAKTTQYRWWAFCWIIGVFFIVPVGAFIISVFSGMFLTILVLIFAFILTFVLTVNCLKKRKPGLLLPCLRSWKCLPIWLRSLEPIDRVVCTKMNCCFKDHAVGNNLEQEDAKCEVKTTSQEINMEQVTVTVVENRAYVDA